MHALTGSQVERHTMPAPVVNEKFYGCKGLRIGFRIHTLLLAIARYFLTFHPTPRILTTHYALLNFIWCEPAHRMEDIYLPVADLIGPEADRRFHRHQAKQLKDMILNHITH